MSKQDENAASDPLLDTRDAALDLNCSESFLAKARMTGTGPEFVKLGRAIRYRQSALNAYKAARTRSSTSQYPTLVSRYKPSKVTQSRSNTRARPHEPDLLEHLSPSISVRHSTSSKR